MHDGTLQALEFDRVVAAVRSLALTPLGAAAIDRLAPQTDADQVSACLAATTEGVAYLEANAPFGLDAPSDLGQTAGALAVEGRILEPLQLVGLARFLSSMDAVCAAFAQAGGGPYPALEAVIGGARSFEREVGAIRAAIDPEGEVLDDASPKLRTLRDRLRRQRNRLRGTLESYLRGRDTAKYLQERVVTERAGRFVLVVRSEHRAAIPGIVHGSSGSGASLFLEPLSTVEINNDIVALEEAESEEVHRILLSLADTLRRRALDLRQTLTAAEELDVIQARASFSRLIDGVPPTLASDARIELPDARHPLLMPAVRERAGESPARREKDSRPAGPVPVDLRIAPPVGALIVTGPNTGGKTVALKTVGLLVLMAQAGLHVPAGPGASLPVFRSVFADIGDEQSIADSLSTFSGHIANIVGMESRLALPALMLLDEVGAGTDPVEGGALGAAIIDHFRRRGALVAATTHDDMLKSYASTTAGVACAGFGFHPATYAPTYKLTYGSPGRSLALEIASRLGVPPSIIDDARGRRSAREAQLAEHLARVERDIAQVDAQRAELAAGRRQLDKERAALEQARKALDEKEQSARRRLRAGVDAEIKAARTAVEEIVSGVRTRAGALVKPARGPGAGRQRVTTGVTGELKRAAVDALENVRERTVAASAPAAPVEPRAPAAPPAVGSRVRIESLGLEGTVVALHGDDAEVEARGKRLRVRAGNIRVVDAPAPTGGGVTVAVAANTEAPQELNVIGCRVDDALSRVEKYVDQALLGGAEQLRVIHGHGTGQLRRAIAGFLDEHPLVAKFEAAAPEHGGRGVTVIELKD
jgi:DNA mismatch repair protein MutS2